MRSFNWERIWAPTWPPLEVMLRSAIVYISIQVLLRLLGRKEWSRYSAFNVAVLFLISVALRTTLVGNDTSLTSGLLSLSTLMAMDWLFSYLSYRSERAANVIEGKPIPLILHGQLQPQGMRRARVSPDRLLEEARLKGHRSLDEVEEAFLERSGQISLLFNSRPASKR